MISTEEIEAAVVNSRPRWTTTKRSLREVLDAIAEKEEMHGFEGVRFSMKDEGATVPADQIAEFVDQFLVKVIEIDGIRQSLPVAPSEEPEDPAIFTFD